MISKKISWIMVCLIAVQSTGIVDASSWSLNSLNDKLKAALGIGAAAATGYTGWKMYQANYGKWKATPEQREKWKRELNTTDIEIDFLEQQAKFFDESVAEAVLLKKISLGLEKAHQEKIAKMKQRLIADIAALEERQVQDENQKYLIEVIASRKHALDNIQRLEKEIEQLKGYPLAQIEKEHKLLDMLDVALSHNLYADAYMK